MLQEDFLDPTLAYVAVIVAVAPKCDAKNLAIIEQNDPMPFLTVLKNLQDLLGFFQVYSLF